MNRPYLLIAGDGYYPSPGTGDWIECYETYGEAEDRIKKEQFYQYYTRGKNKGQIKSTHESYVLKDGPYGDRKIDWYEIVDLRDWGE